MHKRLVAIGHITSDTAEPENVIGGGVSYSGITARELGLDVEIVIKFPSGHKLIDQLIQRDITVFMLPTQNPEVTTFTNIYDSSGKRRQVVNSMQDPISLSDLSNIPESQLKGAFFLIAPVIGEVDTKIIPYLSKYGKIAVTPQGYFREIGKDGTIYQKEWESFEGDLSSASITIFSDEDITMDGVLNEKLLSRIIASSPITILTRGREGATVYHEGKEAFYIHAFPLRPEEIRDLTGAGDTFAASFIAKYLKTEDLHKSAVFASLFAGVKIAGLDGSGVDSIPDVGQLEKFLQDHSLETESFLKANTAQKNALAI